ncbi:zinc finger, CCCH type domain-containing protein [Cryptosporidium serpentis]
MSNRRPCQFFLRGSCRFGDKCRDYHPKSNLFGDNNNGTNQSNINTIPNNPFMSSSSGGNITNRNIFGGNVFNGISPFSNTNSTLTSSSFNNNNTSISTNKTSILNLYLQTLELIGIVVKSGVWPFGPIGLLGQELVFKSMSLNFEEFRWIFYQRPSNDWPSLYIEFLKNLQNLYTDFIEEGRKVNKLPLQHQLYSLDLGSFSQIGNLFLNKGNITNNSILVTNSPLNSNFNFVSIDPKIEQFNGNLFNFNNISPSLSSNSYIFGQSSDNTNIVSNNSTFTSSTKFGLSSNDSNNINQPFKSPFTTSSATNFTSPFNSSINNTNNILTNPNINTSQSDNTQLQVSNNNNNNIFSNNGMNNNTNVFGNTLNNNTLNLQTGFNFVSNSSFNNNSISINNPFLSSTPISSFNNNTKYQENIDIEYNQVQLEEWEEQAFKNNEFEKGKIPEKVPPKNFCI